MQDTKKGNKKKPMPTIYFILWKKICEGWLQKYFDNISSRWEFNLGRILLGRFRKSMLRKKAILVFRLSGELSILKAYRPHSNKSATIGYSRKIRKLTLSTSEG